MEAATRFVDDDAAHAGARAGGRRPMSIGDCGAWPRARQAPSRLSLVDVLRIVADGGLLVALRRAAVVHRWRAPRVTGIMALLCRDRRRCAGGGRRPLGRSAWALLLIPLGLVLVGLGLFLELEPVAANAPGWAWLRAPGGLAGLAYFIIYLVHDRQTPAMLMQYTGVGFWIACFAFGFLLLQHFAVRRAGHHPRGAGRHVGPMGRLRHRLGRLLSGPRANQVIEHGLPLPVPLRSRHRRRARHRLLARPRRRRTCS